MFVGNQSAISPYLGGENTWEYLFVAHSVHIHRDARNGGEDTGEYFGGHKCVHNYIIYTTKHTYRYSFYRALSFSLFSVSNCVHLRFHVEHSVSLPPSLLNTVFPHPTPPPFLPIPPPSRLHHLALVMARV